MDVEKIPILTLQNLGNWREELVNRMRADAIPRVLAFIVQWRKILGMVVKSITLKRRIFLVAPWWVV